MLLPTEDGAWPELSVLPSHFGGNGGYGVVPRTTLALDWRQLVVPVAIPYLGAESITETKALQNYLIRVMQGCFEVVDVKAVAQTTGHPVWCTDGLLAAPERALKCAAL